ncbi:androgen-dependent TFPI-regulating protein-like isoform X2 [Bacillus rossius redtenbacheri]|uniref:androgen-dependent TFPI-regulating protein-like isoform X2 n=1 Tax=Bacillus rossius redtenbacheri TaxID=93214 RepID=UPI002FDE8158
MAAAMHAAAAAQYVYTDYRLARLLGELRGRLPGDSWLPQLLGLQFFTTWSQVLQQGYFAARLVQDLRGYHRGDSALSLLFAGAVLPSSALVVVDYWSLVWLDPGLLDDRELLEAVPAWMNHVMHSGVLAWCCLEQACHPRLCYPLRRRGLGVFSALVLAYLGLCVYVLSQDDVWIYPFFKSMSPVQKAAFFLYNYAIGSTAYLAGERLHGAFRGSSNRHTNMQVDSTTCGPRLPGTPVIRRLQRTGDIKEPSRRRVSSWLSGT